MSNNCHNNTPEAGTQAGDGSKTEAFLLSIPYADFVSGLFVKPVDDPIGQLHHASTGMIGEVAELCEATSRENEIEELGDWEFYYQAMYNTFTKLDVSPWVKPGTRFYIPLPSDSLVVIRHRMIQSNAATLDLTKKLWIYAKPLDSEMLALFGEHLHSARIATEAYYKRAGLDYDTCVLANRLKLLKRYPGASYTDKAAQERADKIEASAK